MSFENAMKRMVRKLRTRAALDDDDVAALLDLPYTLRTYEAPGYIVREGATTPNFCSFIAAGTAVRQKLTSDGNRQIVGMCLPGDFIDLQHLFLKQADHSVQVLNRLQAVDIEKARLEEIVLRRPNIARALWIDALAEASIYREWVLNIGRRDARQRVAHLLCEYALRMKTAGLDTDGGFLMPMTQEQIGDAVGLTSVHVNRTLKALEADGLLRRDRRYVSFKSWEVMREVGDFSALYLHLDLAPPPPPVQMMRAATDPG